jgi:UDP-glucose 4-epimerase
VAAVLGAPDAPEYRPTRPEDLTSVLVDTGAARRALGWEATIPLKEGLSRALDVR